MMFALALPLIPTFYLCPPLMCPKNLKFCTSIAFICALATFTLAFFVLLGWSSPLKVVVLLSLLAWCAPHQAFMRLHVSFIM
jgi:hypothetical protein